jgi:phosphodiesterase/alkaline phosphatase D-like protein
MIVSYATKPMDYETHIDIHQYFPDDRFYYKLKVTDVMNMDYYYEGSAKTLDDVMDCIKLHLKQHQN